MKKNLWLVFDLILAAVYFLLFLAFTGTQVPAAVWVSLGFVLLSHLSLWIWTFLQPQGSYRHLHTWVVSVPCAVYILLTSALGIVFTACQFSLKWVLVIHSALFLLFSGACFLISLTSWAETSGSAR